MMFMNFLFYKEEKRPHIKYVFDTKQDNNISKQ